MARMVSGEPFGEMIRLLTPPLGDVQAEVNAAWRTIAPMSIKTSDKAKKLLVHLLKWWSAEAGARARSSDRGFPPALLESFARQVCISRGLLPVLGAAVFPYFARANLDVPLVARICHVKIGDALLNLGRPQQRVTPVGAIRLSYDESAHVEAGAIDWNDVSWGEDGADSTAAGATGANGARLDLVFAGSRSFATWKGALVPFYLASAGASAAVTGPARRGARGHSPRARTSGLTRGSARIAGSCQARNRRAATKATPTTRWTRWTSRRSRRPARSTRSSRRPRRSGPDGVCRATCRLASAPTTRRCGWAAPKRPTRRRCFSCAGEWSPRTRRKR